MARDDTLFCDGDLPATLESKKKKAVQEASTLNEVVFDRSSDDTVVDEICGQSDGHM